MLDGDEIEIVRKERRGGQLRLVAERDSVGGGILCNDINGMSHRDPQSLALSHRVVDVPAMLAAYVSVCVDEVSCADSRPAALQKRRIVPVRDKADVLTVRL